MTAHPCMHYAMQMQCNAMTRRHTAAFSVQQADCITSVISIALGGLIDLLRSSLDPGLVWALGRFCCELVMAYL